MQFDYEAAWLDLAEPGFRNVTTEHPEILTLLREVTEKHGDVAQEQKTLDLPWPDGLRERFEAFDSTVLAVASFIVYNYGHWMPAKVEAERGLQTWRFTNWADQVLRARCGVSKNESRHQPLGYSFDIDQGLLVLQHHDQRGNSQRDPVGFAAPEVKGTVESVLAKARLSVQPPAYSDVVVRCLTEAAPREGLAAKCFRLGDYMLSDERYAHVRACREAMAKGEPEPQMPRPKTNDGLAEFYTAECVRQAWGFVVDQVLHVNHRLKDGKQPLTMNCGPNHPFMIGTEHVSKSNGVLDPNVAPCKACGREYADHISDRIAAIRLLRNLTREEASKTLQLFMDDAKQDGLDGLVFMETPEKFRIGGEAAGLVVAN